MKVRINLKPYPGDTYFTVREHKARFKPSVSATQLLQEVEVGLRQLWEIPADFNVRVLPVARKQTFFERFQLVNILDDPSTGKRLAYQRGEKSPVHGLLDLSYSFPYLAERGAYDYFLVDPNASLGVPAELMFLFSGDEAPSGEVQAEIDTEAKRKELFVLRGVLNDLADKGIEQCLREANYKAAVLYQLIESKSELVPAAAKMDRSKTCISAFCNSQFRSKIEQLGYEVAINDAGENEQITIANYLTHSKESIEMFADSVAIL